MPRWAATLQSGAHLLFPHAPVEHLHIYVDVASERGLLDLAQGLGWTPDPAGTLRLLSPHYKKSVWEHTQRIGGIRVVSDLQLMIDLWNHPIRGREQAELILEKHMSKIGQ